MNKETETIRGPWESCLFCVECHRELSARQAYGENGVCPYCGHKAEGSICRVQKKVRRWVATYRRNWLGLRKTLDAKWEYKA